MDMHTYTDPQTDRLCDLIAEACALTTAPTEPGPAGVRRLVEGWHVRAELTDLARAADDAATCGDADGVLTELEAWLQQAERALETPEALSA